jgi:hypothetical protein
MDLARVLGAHREQARSTKGRAGRYLLPRQARGSASLDIFSIQYICIATLFLLPD